MDLKASKIGVRTVDYAQGSEADVVILSSVSRSFGTITPYSLYYYVPVLIRGVPVWHSYLVFLVFHRLFKHHP